MTTDFDPYLQWLGISPENQPPNHYALLGLEDFEADREKIHAAADSRLQYLRDFQTGPRGKLSQQLLNEVARAKLCLINAEAKAAYDQKLKHERAPITPPIIKTGVIAPPLPVVDELSAFKINTPANKIGAPADEAQAEAVAAQLSNLRSAKPPIMDGAVAPSVDVPADAGEDSASTKEADQPSADQSSAVVPLFRRKWFPFVALTILSLIAISVWLIGWIVVPLFLSESVVSQPTADSLQQPKPKQGMTTSVFAKNNQIDYPPGIRPQGGQYVLNASNTELAGALISEKSEGRDVLAGWKLDSDRATWKLSVPFPGFYRASINYSATNLVGDNSILLSIGDWKKSHTLRQTAGESEWLTDELIVLLREKGTIEIHLAPESIDGEFHLHEIKLAPRE